MDRDIVQIAFILWIRWIEAKSIRDFWYPHRETTTLNNNHHRERIYLFSIFTLDGSRRRRNRMTQWKQNFINLKIKKLYTVSCRNWADNDDAESGEQFYTKMLKCAAAMREKFKFRYDSLGCMLSRDTFNELYKFSICILWVAGRFVWWRRTVVARGVELKSSSEVIGKSRISKRKSTFISIESRVYCSSRKMSSVKPLNIMFNSNDSSLNLNRVMIWFMFPA